jgi:integrase
MTVLTDLSIRKAKRGDILIDPSCPGLRLRVGKITRSWRYRYRTHAGQLRQVRLGRYPSVSLGEARQRWQRARGQRDDGVDPKEARKVELRAAAEETARAVTVAQLIENYLREHVEPSRKAKGHEYTRRLFERDVTPRIGEMRATDVKRRDVHALVVAIREYAPSSARVARRELAAAFEHALNSGAIELDANPAAGVKAPPQRRRTRFLNDNEIGTFLRWAPNSKLTENAYDVLMLSLMTGMRTGEIVSLAWADVDLKRGIAHLRQTKTDTPRDVQLPRQAVALLRARQTKTAWVFASAHDRRAHIDQKAVGISQYEAKADSGLDDWTSHDMRRTCRTGLARIGAPQEVAELIIGHSKRGVVGVYDLATRPDEQRKWIQKWADHVEALGKSG